MKGKILALLWKTVEVVFFFIGMGFLGYGLWQGTSKGFGLDKSQAMIYTIIGVLVLGLNPFVYRSTEKQHGHRDQSNLEKPKDTSSKRAIKHKKNTGT